MAREKEPPSLDSMLQEARKRKKSEHLANTILGSGRRKSAPASVLTGRNSRPTLPTLASRVNNGRVMKPSSQTPTGPKAQTPRVRHHIRGPGQLSRVASEPQFGGPRNRNADRSNMSIRGTSQATTHTVIGSNFAPGTTAADIEDSVRPYGGGVLSCRLQATYPTVIAEMVFQDKASAENVIATFNGRLADGRLLYVYMRDQPPQAQAAPPSGPRNPYRRNSSVMEIDEGNGNDLRTKDGYGGRDDNFQQTRGSQKTGHYNQPPPAYADSKQRDLYEERERNDRQRNDRHRRDLPLYSAPAARAARFSHENNSNFGR
ncbi:hypothetical protein K402DRAFT_393053 [Aulographum hederae CBS 113979]|uniref:RRM domain-containing protein n=1 Tax=Aulographum hederae CBS 113979 TaxID=1176131 RepID=A0A6G1H2Q4_9PEZI|nr:hypothetical protein K402DRAFT_393053 [Aulographum hederae CBS 113979]